MIIKAECNICDATGLYDGFAEPEGIVTICHGCNGTGRVKLNIKEFTHRKNKHGIHTVRLQDDRSNIIYKEFKNGKMP